MEKLRFALAAFFVVTSLAGPAFADIVTQITLSGGDGGKNWSWNGQGWTTADFWWYDLGVSSTPNGTLVNNPDTTISVPFGQDYWLYADPTNLGETPKVEVITTEKGTLTTIFTLSGTAGTETSWSILEGSSLLQLGWASGSADKVGPWHQLTPNGTDDFYLHLKAGTVPLPALFWLMGTALAGLLASRFRRE
jgi:hypothetical protein